jgi:hypothetical protein
MTLGKAYENYERKLAAKHGCIVRKSPEWRHVPHSNNYGEYMLVDNRNCVIIGDRYDATLDQIEDFFQQGEW